MAALITLDDLEVRGVTFSDPSRADAVIADVSASIRAYTGQEFDLVEDDEVRLRVRNATVRLPQRPVVEVSAVADTDGNSLEFTWDSGDVIALAAFDSLRYFEVEPFRYRDRWIDVTYTHGYETVPEDIVAVACSLAASALSRDAGALGVTQESAGPFSRSFGDPSPMSLGIGDRTTLDRYRRPVGLIRVGL